MSAADDATPYNGTIYAEVVPSTGTPTTEFYRLPLRQKNEITVGVKASNDASISLFDGSKSSNASNIKVEVLLGGDKNSTASIALSGDEANTNYGKTLVQKDKVLSATHFKTFTIRWVPGRVMVYNDGFAKPFMTWNGPKEAQFSHVGVRTVGCSGEWIVQGMPKITTADTKEFQEIPINSGRIDFEIRSRACLYLLLHPEAKFDKAKVYHVGIGWNEAGQPPYSQIGFWTNYAIIGRGASATPFTNENKYNRFWVKWDAYGFWVGRGGDEEALICCSNPVAFMQLNYFSLQACATTCAATNPWAHVHILDQTRPEDCDKPVTAAGSVATGAGGTGGGGEGDAGYFVVQYQYTTQE